MIAILHGTLIQKTPTEVVVDVNGVGYAVSVPLSTSEKLAGAGGDVRLFTHLHVREDVLQLYGFATESERELFRLLISVSGIGPRVALGILSGIPVSDLKSRIAGGDAGSLTAIPGVGRKLAERLVLELREKLTRADHDRAASGSLDEGPSRTRSEVILALTSLGYSRPVAERAMHAALQEFNGRAPSVEELLKAALRHSTTSP